MSTPSLRTEPVLIAPETFVIQHHHRLEEELGVVHVNSMVIRGAEPLVVDTGAPTNREQYLEDVFALVEPHDVRWIFVSHEDLDHIGNLRAMLDACPNATLVTSWLAQWRLAAVGVDLPLARCRWLTDGDVFDVGDRAMVVQRPPLYDSPATHGLLDTSTDVLWAADCFGAVVPEPTGLVADLASDVWRDGFVHFHQWNSPWFEAVDIHWWRRAIARLQARNLSAIASCHGPAICGSDVDVAIDLLRELPAMPSVGQPGQGLLDRLVATMAGGV